MYTKMQSLMLPIFLSSVFLFDGTFQTILVACSLQTSKACTGMLICENDAFKFLKTAKTTNNMCIIPTIDSRLAELFYLS